MQQRKPERLHFTTRDGVPHGATRFLIVTTIAEAAFADEWAELDESVYEHIGREVRETERLHPGRVNDPCPFAEGGKGIERCRRCRVTSSAQRGRYFLRASRRSRCERVDDRRFAHAGLSDQNAPLARK